MCTEVAKLLGQSKEARHGKQTSEFTSAGRILPSERLDSRGDGPPPLVPANRRSCRRLLMDKSAAVALDSSFPDYGHRVSGERRSKRKNALLLHWPAAPTCSRLRCARRISSRSDASWHFLGRRDSPDGACLSGRTSVREIQEKPIAHSGPACCLWQPDYASTNLTIITSLNMRFISSGGTASAAKAKVPCSRISRAARRKAPRAARQSALPTLTRLTPIADRSARLSGTPCRPITTFTGRSTERTTAAMSSLLTRPGA